MAKPEAFFPDETWDGSSPTRDAPVLLVDRDPDFQDWDQMTAEVIAVEEALASGLNGSNVATVANANVIGGTPVVHRINIADTAADTDVVLTHKTRITDVTVVKTTGAGGAGDLITVKNVTTAITNALDINVADKAVVRAGTIDDASHEVAAGAILRITAAKVTNCACIVYVHGIRVA
jgi:hypothetical protein